MRLGMIALAASMLLAPAAFDASFAQSAAVSEKTFDWIFFAIVGIPFIMGLVEVFNPGLSDRLFREPHARLERPGPTRTF
jgi:hypothetical protein